MKRRSHSVLATALLLAVGACTPPSVASHPANQASPTPTPAALVPVASSAPATPSIATTVTALEGIDDLDRQDLTGLFDSTEVQEYWGNDIVSDGSGAYFTAQALGDARPLRAIRALPALRQFRKRNLQTISRTLRLAPEESSKDRAVIEAVMRQRGEIDIDTATDSRSFALELQLRRNFYARKVAGKWRLAKVGRLTIEPASAQATLDVQSLSVKADGQSLLEIKGDSAPTDIGQLPVVRPGQTVEVTLNASRTTGESLQGVMAVLRAPRLTGGVRLQPAAGGGTYSRTFVVPPRPGVYNVGAELLDLTGLLDDPAHVDLSVWGFNLRVQPR